MRWFMLGLVDTSGQHKKNNYKLENKLNESYLSVYTTVYTYTIHIQYN